MAKEKNRKKGSQTKAGLMQKNSDQISDETDKKDSVEDSGTTPKISKNEATDHNHDRPLH